MSEQQRSRPADDGVEHLQVAAREVVAAARSFLDAVEETISDRERLSSIVGSVTELLEGAGRAMTTMSERLGDEAAGRSGDAEGSTAGGSSRVRRIVVEE